LEVTDGTYSEGNPGLGFYLANTTGKNRDYGFTSFTASSEGDMASNEPPVIIENPESQLANVGATVSFSVFASGTAPFLYQWYKDMTNMIPAGTNCSLTLSDVLESDAGYYSVIIDNGVQVQSAVALLTINHPPTLQPVTLQRYASQGAKVPLATLLGTDADGDELTLSELDAISANGASVSLDQDWIVYLPTTESSDSDLFNYSVVDGRGGISSGVVTVLVKPDTAASLVLSIQRIQDGLFNLYFDGMPGLSYVLEVSEELNKDWAALGAMSPDGFGTFEFHDDSEEGQTRFYRVVEASQ
jgi:hypothetical protein